MDEKPEPERCPLCLGPHHEADCPRDVTPEEFSAALEAAAKRRKEQA